MGLYGHPLSDVSVDPLAGPCGVQKTSERVPHPSIAAHYMRVLVKVKETLEILPRCDLNSGMFERHLVFRPYFLCDHGLCAYQVDNVSDTVEVMVGDLTRDDRIVAMAERIFDESPDTFALAGTPSGQEIVGNGLWVPGTWRRFWPHGLDVTIGFGQRPLLSL